MTVKAGSDNRRDGFRSRGLEGRGGRVAVENGPITSWARPAVPEAPILSLVHSIACHRLVLSPTVVCVRPLLLCLFVKFGREWLAQLLGGADRWPCAWDPVVNGSSYSHRPLLHISQSMKV